MVNRRLTKTPLLYHGRSWPTMSFLRHVRSIVPRGTSKRTTVGGLWRLPLVGPGLCGRARLFGRLGFERVTG